MKLYRNLAGLISARINAIDKNNVDLAFHLGDLIKELEVRLPDGSGFANCHVDLDKSRVNKIVINFSYHHMDDNGFYLKWTDHSLTVTPSLTADFEMWISGRDYRYSKEYFYDLFASILDEEV